jgi:heat shock protein HslJ
MRPVRRGRPGLLASLLVLGPVLVLGSLLAACGEDEESTPTTTAASGGEGGSSSGEDLTGTTWLMTGRPVEGSTKLVPAVGQDPTLDFLADGKLAGSTGCNRFFGTWTQDGAGLTVTVGGSTQMACVDRQTTEQEQAVLTVLPETAGFERDGDTLTLTGAEGRALFEYTAGVGTLAGTTWTATGINNGRGALEGTSTTEQASISFRADGTVAVSGGCNTTTLPVTITPPEGIEVGDTGTSTEIGCPPELQAQDEQLVAAMQASTIYTLSGTSLTLRDDQGAMQATFTLDQGATGSGGAGSPDAPVSDEPVSTEPGATPNATASGGG